jgi:hypothetical protein
MTPHDYLVLAIAAFWLATGLLGLGFTIRRLRRQALQRKHSNATAVYWH